MILNQIHKIINKILNKRINKKSYVPQSKTHYGTRYIYGSESGNKLISDILIKDQPLLFCRYGSVELDTLRHFLLNISSPVIQFPEWIKHYMIYNAVFFPCF